MKMTLRVKGKVWKYSGFGGWHFFTIGKSLSAEIRGAMKLRTRGFGSIRVMAQIGETEWNTSIFPTKEGTYLLPIKSAVRSHASIEEGDVVTVQLILL